MPSGLNLRLAGTMGWARGSPAMSIRRWPSAIEAFAAILNKAGYSSPIRTPRGRDILAACGQLKSESEKVRASALRKLSLAAMAGVLSEDDEDEAV